MLRALIWYYTSCRFSFREEKTRSRCGSGFPACESSYFRRLPGRGFHVQWPDCRFRPRLRRRDRVGFTPSFPVHTPRNRLCHYLGLRILSTIIPSSPGRSWFGWGRTSSLGLSLLGVIVKALGGVGKINSWLT